MFGLLLKAIHIQWYTWYIKVETNASAVFVLIILKPGEVESGRINALILESTWHGQHSAHMTLYIRTEYWLIHIYYAAVLTPGSNGSLYGHITYQLSFKSWQSRGGSFRPARLVVGYNLHNWGDFLADLLYLVFLSAECMFVTARLCHVCCNPCSVISIQKSSQGFQVNQVFRMWLTQ